jgi:RimJ/RimL family protein N-acetyltransferase
VVDVLTVAATRRAPALTLRPWRDDDFLALARIPPDPALSRWASFPAGRIDEIRAWIAEQHRARRAGERVSFAVLEDEATGPVAHVVLKRRWEDGIPLAEVGYWTATSARGRGIASRALGAACTWAFTEIKELARLELIHQVDNTASCRVAANAGFVLEAILPAQPPWPLEGHVHVRQRPQNAA